MAGSSQPSQKNIWTVTRLNQKIKDHIQHEPAFNTLWIEGEILNINYHSSGHVYFSLKDKDSQLKCTFFRNANSRFRHIRLENGMKILAMGDVSVYLKGGSYQFNVNKVLLAGEGDLRLRIEQLKKQLSNEGLFLADKKKALPFYPLTIGVATAATGAAIKDIIRVARSRNPGISILLAPCKVQGEMAAASIMAAIEALNDPKHSVDVIIAGRGGGSFEDLLPFNEEAVVRAFFASRIPIVSAVGHDIDHPLSDLAADRYAATPSAAAEMVVPEHDILESKIADSGIRMRVALRNHNTNSKNKLNQIIFSRVFQSPQSLFESHNQQLDVEIRQLFNAMKNQLNGFLEISTRVGSQIPLLFEQNFLKYKSRFQIADERLQGFSPLKTLQRGYSIVRNEKKEIVRQTMDVKAGQSLEVLLSDGKLDVKVLNLIQTDFH